MYASVSVSFLGGSVVKNPPANTEDTGSIPGSGRGPGEGNGNPLQYSCPGNPMDRGAWQATVRGVTKELDTTLWLNNKCNCMKDSTSGTLSQRINVICNFGRHCRIFIGVIPFCILPAVFGEWLNFQAFANQYREQWYFHVVYLLFDCAGSSLLCSLFSSYGERRLFILVASLAVEHRL